MSINKINKSFDGTSQSEQYLKNKSTVPVATSNMARQVSAYRKDVLEKEVHSGLFRDGNSTNQVGVEGKSLAAVTASVGGMKKNAQLSSGYGGGGNFGNGGTVKQAPEVYSPLWLDSNLNLPRDRSTINAWCRSFFALNPFVHNAISLHSTYPISKLNIKCPNKEIEKFFNDMIEEIDLMNICVQIAQEFWLLGEAFVYAELDESRGKWSRLLIQNPDYMIVKPTVSANEPVIMLRPDENLKRIVFSNKPGDIEQRKQLNNHIIDAVKRGENIPMDNFNTHHLTRKISPYEIRGTGLPVCIFRQLMLFDKLRESKFAQASTMINPLTLVKVGTDGPEGLHPTFADLEAWREVFETAANDKDFKIFSHAGISIEKIGSGQGIYDISGDITQLMKEIYVGLQVPQVLMDGGADVSYANGGVALDVLRQRYMQFRNMLSTWLKRKIFAPISKIQGFYDYNNGEKQLIVPDIDWNHMSLFDAGDYIQNLVTLTQGEAAQKRVSIHTLYRSLGLEFEDETRKMRKEAIQAEIAKKEAAALTTMDLNSLRSLDEEDEIKESINGAAGAVPGETGGAGGGLPSASPELPGLDLGSSPPPTSGAPPTPPPAS